MRVTATALVFLPFIIRSLIAISKCCGRILQVSNSLSTKIGDAS